MIPPPSVMRRRRYALDAKRHAAGGAPEHGEPGMRSPDRDLIQRLRERNADRDCATDGHIHPQKPISAVTTSDLRVAERTLGFKLHDLLRSIYTEVANGGFGPEYGIVGTEGGFKLDKCSLESCY